METPPVHPGFRALPAWPVSSQGQRPIQPQLVSASLTLTEIRETTEDELQFVNDRLWQLVALMNPADPYLPEGGLDCV